MSFLKKIQNLSLSYRKIILWAIVSVVGIFLLFFWLGNTKERLFELKEKGPGVNIKLPFWEELQKED